MYGGHMSNYDPSLLILVFSLEVEGYLCHLKCVKHLCVLVEEMRVDGNFPLRRYPYKFHLLHENKSKGFFLSFGLPLFSP
ncbi:hypothetical protein DsansV1_C08g0085731 [Dioscorea sansibarensis]